MTDAPRSSKTPMYLERVEADNEAAKERAACDVIHSQGSDPPDGLINFASTTLPLLSISLTKKSK